MRLWLLTFVGLAAFLATSARGQTLPELPTRYNAIVESNILNKRYSVLMKEYYDGDHHRGRVDFFPFQDLSASAVFLYDKNEAANLINGKCTVTKISDSTRAYNPFGFVSVPGGKVNITTPAELFKFGAEYNVSYVGSATVRGIDADQWTSNSTVNGTTTLTNYYFVSSSWNYKATASKAVPLRLEVSAVANGVTLYNHWYEFVQFNTEDFDDSVFALSDCSSNYLDGHEPFAGVIFGIAIGTMLGLFLAKWSLNFSMKDKEAV